MSKKLLIVILMLTVLLTGCFPSGELKTSSEPAVNGENNGTSSDNLGNSEPAAPKELENVEFNIELDGEYPTELPVIMAKRAVFDVEEMKALFIAGKDIIHEQITDSVNNFYTSDGAWLCVQKSGITFIPDEHMYDDAPEKKDISRMQVTVAEYATIFNKRFPHIDSELPGFPRSEAVERANELVEKVGVKYLGAPTVYTFTAEDTHNFDENITLSKEDEFYLVQYPTTYSDIPISFSSQHIFGDISNTASKVDVLLTKDKLVKLDCWNIFENIEATETTQIKYGGEDVRSRLYEYYSFSEPPPLLLEYEKLSLEYVTFEYSTEEITYKPLWCASGTQYFIDNHSMSNSFGKFVDPSTGYVFDD